MYTPLARFVMPILRLAGTRRAFGQRKGINGQPACLSGWSVQRFRPSPKAAVMVCTISAFLFNGTAKAISFTADSLTTNIFSCTYVGGACGTFFQTNLILNPIGPANGNSAIVNFGGFS